VDSFALETILRLSQDRRTMQHKESQESGDGRRGPRPAPSRLREWEQLSLIPMAEKPTFTPGVNYTFGAPPDYDEDDGL
jgi:hypothetical protein